MNMPDPQAMASAWMAQVSDPSAWQAMMNGAPANGGAMTGAMAGLFKDAGALIKPEAMEALRQDYLQKAGALWQDLLMSKTPQLKDRRFSAPEWEANPLSAFSAASYLLNAEFLTAMADAVEAAPRERQKIQFAVQQMVDAMSPANFLATNPESSRPRAKV